MAGGHSNDFYQDEFYIALRVQDSLFSFEIEFSGGSRLLMVTASLEMVFPIDFQLAVSLLVVVRYGGAFLKLEQRHSAVLTHKDHLSQSSGNLFFNSAAFVA